MIYLDNASTTKPCDEAVNAIIKALNEDFGNPSSLHKLGVEAEKIITEARNSIAYALGCDPESIYFTSGATESNNMAVNGIAENYGRRKNKIVTTEIEHPSVYETISKLEKKGFEVVRIAPDKNGEITAEAISSAVDNNTFLVSCLLVNNETGTILPIKKAFAQIKRDYPQVITHCDAVQAFMKIPLKARQLSADVISISGHKVGGPKGVGAIYIKKGIRVAPQITGGGQEKKQRSGTESVPLISGFGAAVKKHMNNFNERLEYVKSIKSYLLEKAKDCDEITVLSNDEASPYIITIAVNNIKSEIMLHYLESHEIYVSSGSACSKGAKSKVLKAFNIPEKYLDFTLRISICEYTTVNDINILLNTIKKGSENLIHINK